MRRDGSVAGQNSQQISLLNRRRFLVGLTSSGIYLATMGHENLLARDASNCKDPRMVTGELKSWKSNPRLLRMEPAFRFLERPDLKDLPAGRQEIDGDKMYALVMKTPTRAVESAQFEAHRKYIDVHYIISGQDTTGFYPSEELKVADPYSDKLDIEMFAVPPSYTILEMYPGRFAAFFPGGGHMPNCHLKGPHDLHKIVVKVGRDFGIK
jgi:biofilm protein TabA